MVSHQTLLTGIELARQAPEQANLDQLYRLFDQVFSQGFGQPMTSEHLLLAGPVLEQLAQVLNLRSQSLLDHWHDEQLADELEPVLEDLDAWVRQSMNLDLTGWVESLPDRRSSPKSPSSSTDDSLGKIDPRTTLDLADHLQGQIEIDQLVEADPEKLLLDWAGQETFEDWQRTIATYLTQNGPTRIRLVDLQQQLQMPLVEIWLGLLHGDYGLSQQGDFYATDSVWVETSQNSSQPDPEAGLSKTMVLAV